MTMVEIGIVRALFLYPVKSMAGTALEATTVGWHGLDGDRRYAFLRTDSRSGFPWLTARELPAMLQYHPRYFAGPLGKHAAVQVRTPEGQDLDVASDELSVTLSQAAGMPCRLLKCDRGLFDDLGISLLSMSTVQAIADITGCRADPIRFRPNIVIESVREEPYVEDAWVDHQIVFGDQPDGAKMRVNSRDPRCVMVNIDPQTLEKNAHVLRTIAQTRDGCLGVYGSTETPGTIRIGDVVRLVQ